MTTRPIRSQYEDFMRHVNDHGVFNTFVAHFEQLAALQHGTESSDGTLTISSA